MASIYIKKVTGDEKPAIEIFEVNSQSPTENSVIITWETNSLSTSKVEFGVTQKDYVKVTDTTMTYSHLITLTGLLPATPYSYCVYSQDISNNIAESCGHSFTTLGEVPQDVTPPEISNIQINQLNATWAKITWDTNEIATSIIEIGATSEYGTVVQNDTALSVNHAVYLLNLTETTKYHFKVRSTDGSGNNSVSSDMVLETTELPNLQEPPILPSTDSHHSTHDAAPLVIKQDEEIRITKIEVNKVNASSAEIFVSTNNNATVQIEYGLTEKYGEQTPARMNTEKEITHTLVNLKQNTEYHFRATVTDINNKQITSEDIIFTTTPSSEDTTSPEFVHDLSITDVNESSVELSWSTPYDQNGIRFYDINYSQELMTEENFYNASVNHKTTIKEETLEQHGKMHSYRVVGLTSGQLGYFAIKASDSFGNISPISNIVSVTTPGGKPITEKTDIVPPAMVRSVQAVGLDRVITIWWKNPNDPDFVRTEVVRNDDHYPTSPNDGVIIYAGSGNVVSDAPLKNGTTYYYSLFAHDDVPNYSLPVNLSISPSKNNQDYTVYDIGTVDHTALGLLVTKELKRGDNEHEVRHLQSILATDPSVYGDGLITGYFGPLTERAVLSLQEKNNIPTTGKVDVATREVINKLPLTSFLAQEIGNEMITAFAHDIYYGTQGEDVRALQSHLAAHGLLKPDQVTGKYGPETRDAVIKLQKEQGTPIDGIVGPITRSKIIDHVYQIMEKEGLLSPR